MKALRDISIRNKLIGIIMSVAFISLFAGFLVVTISHLGEERAEMKNVTLHTARLVAEFSVAPLTFNDKKGASEVLQRLSANPSVLAASIFDNDGKPFTSYTTIHGAEETLSSLDNVNTGFSEEHLVVIQEIRYKGEKYGSLYIRASTESVDKHIRGYLLSMAGSLLGTLVLAFFLALRMQRIISDPVLELAKATNIVSKKGDYDVRVSHRYNDEIGELVAGFNTMLEQIQAREKEKNLAQNELRHSEEALRSILEGTASAIGSEFFRSLVHHLGSTLEVRYAFIGELRKKDMVRTLAVWANGEFRDNFEYLLADTPCYNVIQEGLCFYPRDVAKNFPKDELLREMQVQGYLGSPLKDSAGNVLGLLVVMHDTPLQEGQHAKDIVTIFASRAAAELSRKKAEEEGAKLGAQLRHGQKLETLGTLAGGIAHDFNNLLSPVIGYTEMLLRDVGAESPLHTHLQQVYSAAKRARDLVRQILLFSGQGEQERNPLRVHLVINEALKLLRPTLPSTIEIRKRIDHSCDPVLADPTQIHQIFMNLCTNAFHALQDNGGVLEVGLKMTRVEPDSPHPHDLSPGDYVCLSVSDNGCGMDQITLDRIFDPFFTTKPPGKGTGLGLSVVHGIVTGHGGEIRVQSELGQGTSFFVYLPPAHIEVKEDAAQESAIPGGNERVMFVDDEKGIALMAKQMLARLGYEVTVCTNSLDALETFRRNSGRFDLVITDQTMPRMTGIQLAKEMTTIRPDLPIILTSGFGDIVPQEQLLSLGISGYLRKPIETVELAAIIRKTLERHT